MKGKLRFAACLMAVLCLTGCTTAGENAEIYFSKTSEILSALFSSGGQSPAADGQADTEEKEKLPTPAEFSIDADGNYSFEGVDNASYYIISFCAPDATSDEDSYLFASDQIEEDGSGEYTGACKDLFDYAYGEYLAKVYAYPDIEDKTYDRSEAGTAEYVYTGNQSAPEICYFWDKFSGTMNVQVGNRYEYEVESFPKRVDVTFTNVNDAADTLTLSIEDVSTENYSASTTELRRGETYQITAVSYSENPCVLNPTSDTTTVSDALTIGDINLVGNASVQNYYYSGGFDRDFFNFPIVQMDFDPVAGGDCGMNMVFPVARSTNIPMAKFGVPLPFEATPKETTPGSLYSYDVATYEFPAAGRPADNRGEPGISGALEIYPDGTLTLSVLAKASLPNASINGTWVDNGDGTLTLSYDQSSIIKN